jgi:hypothetical protein
MEVGQGTNWVCSAKEKKTEYDEMKGVNFSSTQRKSLRPVYQLISKIISLHLRTLGGYETAVF